MLCPTPVSTRGMPKVSSIRTIPSTWRRPLPSRCSPGPSPLRLRTTPTRRRSELLQADHKDASHGEEIPSPAVGRRRIRLVPVSRELNKHEEVGDILNVLESFLKGHLFPRPGFVVRVLGDVTEGKALEVLRQVDEIFVQAIKDAGMYDTIWQAFVVFLTVQTAGVNGDQRTHSHAVILQEIANEDGMNADWGAAAASFTGGREKQHTSASVGDTSVAAPQVFGNWRSSGDKV